MSTESCLTEPMTGNESETFPCSDSEHKREDTQLVSVPGKTTKVRKQDSYALSETIEITDIQYNVLDFPTAGDETLHARQPLCLRYVEASGNMVVEGWNLELPLRECEKKLPGMIGRRFMELYHQAMAGKLSDPESIEYEAICRQIDIGAFEAARTQPAWHTGTLARKKGRWTFSFWLGGKHKPFVIPNSVADRFSVLKSGDFIGAYFSFDRNGEISDMEGIQLEAPPPHVPLPGATPKNGS